MEVTEKQLASLTSSKKLVYGVLVKGVAKTDDLAKIAKLCNLTDLQVIVSIQLLIHKRMLPTDAILH